MGITNGHTHFCNSAALVLNPAAISSVAAADIQNAHPESVSNPGTKKEG
jgi:hypothetical protein